MEPRTLCDDDECKPFETNLIIHSVLRNWRCASGDFLPLESLELFHDDHSRYPSSRFSITHFIEALNGGHCIARAFT